MPIPAFLIGAGIVGGMWALSKKPQPSPTIGGVNAAAKGLADSLNSIASTATHNPADDPAIEMDPDPAQPAVTVVTQTSPEGATDTSTSTAGGSGGGGGSSVAIPSVAPSFATPPGTPPPPPVQTAPEFSPTAGYVDLYGAASTKAQKTAYYTQQAAAGQIIY